VALLVALVALASARRTRQRLEQLQTVVLGSPLRARAAEGAVKRLES
jgi:hypothetical protein